MIKEDNIPDNLEDGGKWLGVRFFCRIAKDLLDKKYPEEGIESIEKKYMAAAMATGFGFVEDWTLMFDYNGTNRSVIAARQFLAWMLQFKMGINQYNISKLMGKHHSTIAYSVDNAIARAEQDNDFNERTLRSVNALSALKDFYDEQSPE